MNYRYSYKIIFAPSVIFLISVAYSIDLIKKKKEDLLTSFYVRALKGEDLILTYQIGVKLCKE